MRRSERGNGKIGLIIMVLVLAALIFVLVKWIPPRINAYEFKDYVETYARTESWTRTPEQIQKDLLIKAASLDLNVTEENIKIDKSGANIAISVNFDIRVDLVVFKPVQHYEFTQKAEHY